MLRALCAQVTVCGVLLTRLLAAGPQRLANVCVVSGLQFRSPAILLMLQRSTFGAQQWVYAMTLDAGPLTRSGTGRSSDEMRVRAGRCSAHVLPPPCYLLRCSESAYRRRLAAACSWPAEGDPLAGLTREGLAFCHPCRSGIVASESGVIRLGESSGLGGAG